MAGKSGTQDTRAALEQRLGHTFNDRDLLALALTHASAAGKGPDNERLEFLGDRVLGLVIAEMLYHRFPEEPEGRLARRQAALVERDALARIANHLDLARAAVLGRGGHELDRANATVMADLCEAVIGALYLDGGLSPAAALIRALWAPLMEEAAGRPPVDPKTALQEWAQGHGLPLPSYETVAQEGPSHEPLFRVAVSLPGYERATGEGSSKRVAAKQAAEAMLEKVQG